MDSSLVLDCLTTKLPRQGQNSLTMDRSVYPQALSKRINGPITGSERGFARWWICRRRFDGHRSRGRRCGHGYKPRSHGWCRRDTGSWRRSHMEGGNHRRLHDRGLHGLDGSTSDRRHAITRHGLGRYPINGNIRMTSEPAMSQQRMPGLAMAVGTAAEKIMGTVRILVCVAGAVTNGTEETACPDTACAAAKQHS